jgi:XTP/dITP diphosphohydrolase
MKIILSTRNPSKTEQIKAMFTNPSIQIFTLDEVGIDGEAVEDADTLKENAFKKAIFARKDGFWTMADDTGIFIRALNGEPGVRSARWAGEDATTDEITEYCLARLDGHIDRSAKFETVVALVSPEGKEYFFTGFVDGNILLDARSKPQPKMPYSPLFVPVGHIKNWAEMTTEEENQISHRGLAFKQVVEFLNSLEKNK